MMNLKRIFCLMVLLLIGNRIKAQQLYTGYATHFDGLGTPYGGCGVPDAYIGTSDYVALNVFNRPNTGTSDYTRPLKGADTSLMGEFKNGKNCGRWVKVIIEQNCINGQNAGQLNAGFCTGSGSSWQDDKFSGAVRYMIVADACGDNNGWCRQSPYHLDLHTSSLNSFDVNNQPVDSMYPIYFNNRIINWEYIPAPNYSGDIKICFMQGSSQYWASIFITNLPNGIHGVEQLVNNQWVTLSMNSDMGQAYLLQVSSQPFIIRVIDANDHYLQNGRQYKFNFPASCGQACSPDATCVTYTVIPGTVTPVTYVMFEGSRSGQNNVLNWSTGSESQNNYFNVERSSDGINFSHLGTIKGNGTTNNISQYVYIDKNAPSQILYYRLTQVDNNGTQHYSKIISISPSEIIEFNIYPNPSTEYVTVKFSAASISNGSILFFNELGMIVIDQDMNIKPGINSIVIDINSLPPSVYFIKVTGADGVDKIYKFMKQ